MNSRTFRQHLWRWLFFSIPYRSRRLLGAAGWFKQPDFLIIGAQRAGTTALYGQLTQQPQVRPALLKEIHYFDLNSQKPPSWYLAHFPLRLCQPFVTGEASPYYLFHPAVPRRVFALLPAVKLIVLLRHPVHRAYSNYHHAHKLGFESRSFREAVEAEMRQPYTLDEPMQHRELSYLARGIYHEQLTRWRQFFPADQLLILKSEDYFTQPEATLRRVMDYLALPVLQKVATVDPETNANLYPEPIAPALKEELNAFFAPHNQQLAEHFEFPIEDWT